MNTTNAPVMLQPQRATANWTVLPSFMPVPGLGVLAVNSFLLKSEQPLLVDTGLAMLGAEYLDTLKREIDLEDLRYIWLSHMDADHIGNLVRILEQAPNARIITNFLGMGKMGLAELDVSRVQLLEPGARLVVGKHSLIPFRPPYYDAPETIGFFDSTERVLFVADSFGALLPEPVAELTAVDQSALREGMVQWSAIDAPWLGHLDQSRLSNTLAALDRMDATAVLSAHLPLAKCEINRLGDIIRDAWCAGPTAMDPLAIEQVAIEAA